MTKLGVLLLVSLCLLLLIGGVVFWLKREDKRIVYSPLSEPVLKVVERRPLDQYAYENLRRRGYSGSEIRFQRMIKADEGVQTWLFLFESDGKKISGALNMSTNLGSPSAGTLLGEFVPAESKFIVMIHGSVETEDYYQGYGTEHVAGELAKNGYVTLAPDFAGLGESGPKAEDDFEARFQTYTAVLNLIESIESSCMGECRIGIWGHSNGGQIALSVLEISGRPIPTVLWNPVSKFFPYSILYYTDSFEDKGKILRKLLAKFEEKYDVEKYSVTNFLDWINAPILLQQGEDDPWVPKEWSDELADSLRRQSKEVEYKVYASSDHNLQPKWGEAVNDLTRFYLEKL